MQKKTQNCQHISFENCFSKLCRLLVSQGSGAGEGGKKEEREFKKEERQLSKAVFVLLQRVNK